MGKLKAIWQILTHKGMLIVFPQDWEGIIINNKTRRATPFNITEEQFYNLMNSEWYDIDERDDSNSESHNDYEIQTNEANDIEVEE